MVTKLTSQQPGWVLRLVMLSLAGGLLIALILPSWVLAQTFSSTWAEPINLSHSGIAAKPGIVLDSNGIAHALWLDDLENYVYAQGNGNQWSPPEITDLNNLFDLPVAEESIGPAQMENHTGPNPWFIASTNQLIFSFWITPQGQVFTSRVENQNFSNAAAWEGAQLITPGAASFAVAIDLQGELHLAFIRVADDPINPPGIYYTRSKNIGRSWARPVLLYESPYLRRLAEGEAHISLATTGTEEAPRVYIAWDNRQRKQVLLTQSADGGESWSQPTVVAGPVPGSGLAGPFNAYIDAIQDSVVLVWQNGRPGGACSQIYQSSSDAGVTWSDPQPMMEDLLGCMQSNGFLKGLTSTRDGILYFVTETQSQVFLTAWNGTQWSQPQVQPVLSGFEDPEIYSEVIYGCRRASLLGMQMYIIGCDQNGGGDVWVTSRDLGPRSSWFSSPVWSQPSTITDDELYIESFKLVATSDNLIHAFFSKRQDPGIYYTYWDGELWSNITPVLQLPDGDAGRPAIAAGAENELILLAPNNKGALYFSRATSGNAAIESSWSIPTRLGIDHEGDIGSVDVALDAAGTLYAAYSVPVNEERGIYLIQSKDLGTSWSEPLQVFNGAAAGFDLIGAPSLRISDRGLIHIVWKQQTIQGDGVPQALSLFYTRSEDSGHTFSNAELIVEEPVTWREIEVDNEGGLHLLWQLQDTMTAVWDQVSLDGGRSWQFPKGLPDEGMTAATMIDDAGRLHLLNASPGSLRHWLWDGSRWQPEAPLHWSTPSQDADSVNLLAAASNKQGKMVVVLAEPADTGDEAKKVLLFSTRSLKLPPRQTAIEEAPSQTLLPSISLSATVTPERLLTPASTNESELTNSDGQININETNDRISPVTIAMVPVALLLLSVLGIAIRRATQAKDK